MHKMLIAGIAGALLTASAAMASEPVKLTEAQMDDVTAGWRIAGGLGFTGGSGAMTFGATLGGGSTQSSGSEVVDTSELFIGNLGQVGFVSVLGTTTTATSSAGYATIGLKSGGMAKSYGTFSAGAQFNSGGAQANPN